MSKKKNRFAFPAVFHYADDGISIEFPNLPGCFSCSATTEEALTDAKEALGLHLWGMEQDGEEIPEPTSINKLQLQPNEILVLIDVFMPSVRDRIENGYIKKTLSVPRWLNTEAEKEGVNFSHVLQSALKEYLGISEERQSTSEQ